MNKYCAVRFTQNTYLILYTNIRDSFCFFLIPMTFAIIRVVLQINL